MLDRCQVDIFDELAFVIYNKFSLLFIPSFSVIIKYITYVVSIHIENMDNTSQNHTENIFTDEQISNIVGLYHTLKRIHNRLIEEGYQIKNNKIIPPNKQKPHQFVKETEV